jgi:hypothetical protein
MLLPAQLHSSDVRNWRSPVSIEGADLLFDWRTRPEEITLHPGHEIPLEFATVRTPADAKRYAEQWGWLGLERDDGRRTGAQFEWMREPLAKWLDDALTVREIVRLNRLLQIATSSESGSHSATQELRHWYRGYDQRVLEEEFGPEPIGDYPFFNVVAKILAIVVSERLEHVRTVMIVLADVAGNQPAGRYTFSAAPTGGLREVIFHELAKMLIARVQTGECEHCGCAFAATHGNRRFCTDAHANAARQRRFVDSRRNSR